MVSLPAAAFRRGGCASSPFDAGGCTTAGSTIGGTSASSSNPFATSGFLSGAGGFPRGERNRCRRQTVAESLVRDRYADFERLARQLNNLPAVGSTAISEKPSSDAKKMPLEKGFMRDFFEAVNEIQSILNKGKQNVKAMGEVLEDALMATTQERQKEVSERREQLVEDTNRVVSLAKMGLETLKQRSDVEEAKAPGSAEGKIRQNMQQAMAKKHQQLLMDFQKAQVDYKKVLQQRQHKEMEILMPTATEEERERMIEAGETTALAVAKKMAGAHALLLDEVQRIREKHQDICRLETSICELAQMFQEMAVLVEAQGEMLDAIELNVHQAKGATAKAETELIQTRKEQHKYSKYMCCLTVTLVIVIIVVLGPILLKLGG